MLLAAQICRFLRDASGQGPHIRNRRDVLRDCLLRYAEQTHGDIELVVVDNGSTDGTPAMMAERFPDVVYRWMPDNIGPLALNLAASLASGEFFWRTDDDAYPATPDTFERALAFFARHPDVDVLAGEVVQLQGGYVENWYPFDYDTVPDEGLPVHFFHGCAVMFRRNVFIEAGGFHDRFYNEEADLAARILALGNTIRYVPSIRAHHLGAFDRRYMSVRWLLMSRQVVRFQFKYFPFWRAAGRSSVIAVVQIMLGLFHRFHPLVLLEGISGMMTSGLSARRTEFRVLTKEQLDRITMGESQLRVSWRYLKSAVRRRTKTGQKQNP